MHHQVLLVITFDRAEENEKIARLDMYTPLSASKKISFFVITSTFYRFSFAR